MRNTEYQINISYHLSNVYLFAIAIPTPVTFETINFNFNFTALQKDTSFIGPKLGGIVNLVPNFCCPDTDATKYQINTRCTNPA